ncbi:rRNA maturation RNase YbeY [Jeongeupia naejangsanensis]|uniref:Endoribonuclease YbeY n=1 Tax=Jeongeupia naejangsanensis TaxID=613195 RepID=A0ABS2BPM2_9NEIS|nr:rRNA maturation RNase YbeY [Jeongeupia naejangsanensis]MBM3117577.1 rRNA maturation RNase YbeY [Jeongeupia naejangsanensis]
MSRRLKLALQVATDAAGLPGKAQLKTWMDAALRPGVKTAEITVRIVDAEEGQQLNRDYRGKDYATNVLTFTFDDDMPAVEGLPLFGDLVLCAPVVEREAQEQGKTLLAHYCHMIVHGTLHLQGYDHIEDDEADEMEALETQIVTTLGYDDPYRTDTE